MEYLWIKLIHILGAILILGTGMGSAFYLFRANRSREIHSIYFAARNAVWPTGFSPFRRSSFCP